MKVNGLGFQTETLPHDQSAVQNSRNYESLSGRFRTQSGPSALCRNQAYRASKPKALQPFHPHETRRKRQATLPTLFKAALHPWLPSEAETFLAEPGMPF